MATTTRTDARRAALSRLIDHAALFPPASMSMGAALAEDQRVRSGPEAWIVHRFVVPASRFGDLGKAKLPLSVVCDVPHETVDKRVEAMEVRERGGLTSATRRKPELYVELPPQDHEDVAMLAALGARAKVRCGGAAVPSVEALAAFIRTCRLHGVPFKATAGLHRPIRAAGEHGFLNLLAAAVFGDEEEVLADEDPASFRLDSESFAWRDSSCDAGEVGRVRRELFVSFGSCSVAEPVDHLRELGILPR